MLAVDWLYLALTFAMLILYVLLCLEMLHILCISKVYGVIQQTVFPWSPVDPIGIVSCSVDLPTLWSEAFCYVCTLIVLSVGIVHRLKGLCTNANSLSNTLRIYIIMAA